MKKLFPILACAVAMMVSCKQDTNTTEDEGIVLHYDFSAVEGITVKDLGPNHVDAQLMNGATVEDGNLVLFADDAYLDMTAKAGEVMQTLRVLNSVPTHGGAPCNIIISPEKKEVITANYVGGSITVFPIDKKQMLEEGRLVQFEGKGVNVDRQEQPHLHAVNFTPDGCFLLVACRDSNVVQIFARDMKTGLLSDTGKTIQKDKPVCVIFAS